MWDKLSQMSVTKLSEVSVWSVTKLGEVSECSITKLSEASGLVIEQKICKMSLVAVKWRQVKLSEVRSEWTEVKWGDKMFQDSKAKEEKDEQRWRLDVKVSILSKLFTSVIY